MAAMRRALGAVCMAMGAIGCGTDPASPSEDTGTVTTGLDYPNGCPSGYPNTALPFDTYTSQCSTSGDWDHTGIISPRSFFTSDTGYYFAAECGLASNNHHYIVGISVRTDVNRPHSAKCATNFHNVGIPSSRHYLSRANSSGAKINDPTVSNVGFDWDPGAIKAECGYRKVVTGVAQLESNEIDAISCNSASIGTGTNRSTCNALKFDRQNHCGQSCGGSSDWAYGYYKNICRSDQYIKGVSKRGPLGEISAILCCNWN
jgi:hypothetical protein